MTLYTHSMFCSNGVRSGAVRAIYSVPAVKSNFALALINLCIIEGGGCGGIYVPHIATVIQEGNHAIASGRGRPGATQLNLELFYKPFTYSYSYFRWLLKYRCVCHNVCNDTTCKASAYAMLSERLEVPRSHNQRILYHRTLCEIGGRIGRTVR
ncbi:hypothetical protein GGU10DRAFT_89642 [Lentinula aff. detonsa]|uniref:Uncharacterized protein n=1 Tax=Lentinula aff. detonsa TaxID=2804958 RepID=A0AA38NLH9_9AGAR|nr:hypothetical protein GGU10DRAFT_89642 [Lentinula aff. detonsa]